MDAPCVFCGIVAGNEPASVVYRDDRCMAFLDIRPVTDGHLLVIPLAHATYLADLDPDDGARIFRVGQRLAAALRRTDGLRCDGINLWLADGAVAGQEVFHVHLHVLPRFAHDGFGLRFPPDYGQLPPRAMLNEQAARIRMNL